MIVSNRHYLLHIIIWLLLVLLIGISCPLPADVFDRHFGVSVTPNGAEFIDFASIFTFATTTVQHGGPLAQGNSVYSLANHLEINRHWAGSAIDIALSFGYSPTMFWLLAPISFLTSATAYWLVTIGSLLSAWWLTLPFRSRYGVALLAFFSPSAFGTFYLGQTSILTSAGLLFLYEKTKDTAAPLRTTNLLLVTATLWALTAKPPLAITAAAGLLAMRVWRPVALAIILTGITTIGISPLLGEGWWRDYLNMLTHYNKLQMAPEFAWSFHPELMTNLHGVLSTDFGMSTHLASSISTCVWALLLAAIVTLAPRARLAPGATWALVLLAYLAFCPHVSDTEEIQLILLVPFCVPPANAPCRWQDLLVLAIACLACFASPARSPFIADNRLILFGSKIFLLIYVAAIHHQQRALSPENDENFLAVPYKDSAR